MLLFFYTLKFSPLWNIWFFNFHIYVVLFSEKKLFVNQFYDTAFFGININYKMHLTAKSSIIQSLVIGY